MGIVISGSSPQGQPGAEIHCPGSGKSHPQTKPLWILEMIRPASLICSRAPQSVSGNNGDGRSIKSLIRLKLDLRIANAAPSRPAPAGQSLILSQLLARVQAQSVWGRWLGGVARRLERTGIGNGGRVGAGFLQLRLKSGSGCGGTKTRLCVHSIGRSLSYQIRTSLHRSN